MPVRSRTFLAVTFGVSWGTIIAAYAAGAANKPGLAFAALAAPMAGPAIGGVICALLFDAGRRNAMLGLRFKPTLWWLAVWGLPATLSFGAVAFTRRWGLSTSPASPSPDGRPSP